MEYALPALTTDDVTTLSALASEILAEIGDEVDAGIVRADPEMFRGIMGG